MTLLESLTDLGIVYSDVEEDIYKLFSKHFFDDYLNIKYTDIWIPTDDFYETAMLTLDSNEELESMPDKLYGLSRTPIDDWEDVSTTNPLTEIPVPLPYCLLDAIDTDEEDLIFSQHGNNILLNTSTNPKHVRLETKVTEKNSDSIDNDLELDIMSAYYYLYRGNTEEAYVYIRNISSVVNNSEAKNKRTLQERKIPTGRKVTAWQL